MAHDQKTLLEAAAAVDAAMMLRTVKIGKAILSVPPDTPAPVPKPHELQLVALEDDDPFSGNVNNRNVAKRIAAQNRKLYTNTHKIIHTGDPMKAAKDVEKSLEVNPDSLSPNEQLEADQHKTAEALRAKTPSPGSPAAVKANGAAGSTAPAAPGAPVPWTPNAGRSS